MTQADAVERARELVAEHGVCLFIVDIVDSNIFFSKGNREPYQLLQTFAARANELYSDYFPENELSIPDRVDKGFILGLGDAAWVGINSADVLPKLFELLETEFPELKLHFGVAADAWDEAFRLAK